jgi:hypothetical protein
MSSQIQIIKPEIELEKISEISEISEEIDHQIATERNRALSELSTDMGSLYELFQDCSNLIFGQTQHLEEVEDNLKKSLLSVEEGTIHLEKAAQYQKHSRGKIFDICMLVGGAGVGLLGWVGGPWVGIPTMAAGLGLSGGIVVARNKIESMSAD